MKGSGRVSLVGLLSVLALGLVVSVLFMSKESLGSVGSRFMSALSKGDVDSLTKMSYTDNKNQGDMRKQWETSVKVGKYYNFFWRVLSSTQADANTGSVRVGVTKSPESGSSYEENFALPMIKVGDEWKVDVKAISREMYPALPR